MSQADKPRVVIVGGGFGGLEAARAHLEAARPDPASRRRPIWRTPPESA